MKRRDFLKVSGATVGAPLVGLSACHDDHHETGTIDGAFDLLSGERVLDEVESMAGTLKHTMTLKYADLNINGQRMRLRTFNGKFPPETLVAKPGDTLEITFDNQLPASEEDYYHPNNINIPHGFNNSNLHTHGLNVSPAGDEDNVLMVIHPGESFTHHIKIPEDHPSGVYWYHPHKHGSAVHQVASGMAGFIRIEGGPDDLQNVPEIAAAKSVDLGFHELIHDFSTPAIMPAEGNNEAVTGDPNPDPAARNPIISMFKGQARMQYTINGVAVDEGKYLDFGALIGGQLGDTVAGTPPVIKMRPGEVQHWRLGMLCHLQTYKLIMDGHDINVVGWDGITTGESEVYNEDHPLILGPANRVDILVKASTTPGTYSFKMLTEQFGQNVLFVTPSLFEPELPLFNVVVEGEPMNMDLPSAAALSAVKPTVRLPTVTQAEIDTHVANGTGNARNIHYRVTGDASFTASGEFAGDNRQYYINNMQFNAKRINETVLLGAAEEWTIHNHHASENNQLNHPFHIHVNWFEIKSLTNHHGDVEVMDQWGDSVDVPHGGTAVIRHRFENYTGIFPHHCHVLAHEDEGMMALVEVVDGAPVTQSITSAAGGSVASNDYGRTALTFGAGNFATDAEVTHHYVLAGSSTVDAMPAAPAGMVALERHFNVESDTAMVAGQAATVTVKFPLALSSGATYDLSSAALYKEVGGSWVQTDINVTDTKDTSHSATDPDKIVDGLVKLDTGMLTAQVSDLTAGDTSFAVFATELTGPVSRSDTNGAPLTETHDHG